MLTLNFSIPLIFGVDYVESIDIARVLILGAIFGSVYQVLTRHFTSLAQQKYSVISALCGLTVGIVSCVMLTALYGGLGAAIAFGVSSLITAIISLHFFCATTDTPVLDVFKINRKDFLLI